MPRRASRRLALAALAAPLTASPALAQEAAESAVESAEDAFGTSTGHESIGVYDEDNVRGFSPGNAGNFRMEGMYFDIQGSLGNRVIDGEVIRVGPAAQGYAFPAPTGIVDLQLKKAGDRFVVSPFVSTDSFGAVALEVDAHVPLIAHELGVVLGAGVYNDHYANGGRAHGFSLGLAPRWRPARGVEVLAFYNRHQSAGETAGQLFIPTGDFLPQRIARGRFFGPSWATGSDHSDTFGTVGHANLGDWTLRAGLFHSAHTGGPDYTSVIRVDPAMATTRTIFAHPGNHAGSWSGEARLSRRFAEGPRQHLITAALRGRTIDATYGGGDARDLGAAAFDAAIEPARPAFRFGAQTGDDTRQATAALGYSLKWAGLGEVTLGLQRTHYVKEVANPGLAPVRGTSTATLPTFSAALTLTPRLTAYGSYLRGLEDAGSAPGYAANANEVLPAIRTRQYDGGLRWSPVKDTTLILGYFWIAKPLIDFDRANRFGVLGEQTHKGIEASLTSNVTKTLRVVAGGVWLDPVNTAAPTSAEPIGRRPVGQQALRTRFNVNWTLPGAPALTLDAYVNHDDGAYGTIDNRVFVPGSTRIGLGARYRFKLGGKPVTARVSLFNLFDAYQLVAVASGVYVYNTLRNVQAWLAMEL